MAYKVLVSRLAERDIEQAFIFMGDRSPRAANTWLDNVQQAITSLAEMPNRAALIPENTRLNSHYRHLIHNNFRIVFQVNEEKKTVSVIRVYHSARQPLGSEDVA